MVDQRLLSRLAFFASFFALGVIALGAFTRLIDAGLGCPDWPGCYGYLLVPSENQSVVAYKAWAEMIHRYFVGGLSIFIISIITLIFSNKKVRQCSNVILAISLFLLLIYQIILGRWTVTFKLLPIVVTQHLLGGFLILAILWLIYLNNKKITIKPIPINGLLPLAIIGFILVFLQIMLGAWTSTNYASLSCPDLPFCINDQPLMTMYFKEAFNIFSPLGINYEGGVLSESIRQTIQMTHRIGALVVMLYMLFFSGFAMHKLKDLPEMVGSLYLILGLLIVQLCIGMANVILKLPLITAVSHTLVAVLLLLSIITFIFKLTLVRKVSLS